MKAILFDLDGTLLPMDTDDFLTHYFKAIAGHVKHIMEPNTVIEHIMSSTKAVIVNEDAQRTNEQVFIEEFLRRSKLRQEDIWPVFDQFYADVFPELRAHVHPNRLSRRIIQEALQQGYRLVVATNPVFPRAAIRERMKWSEIDDLPFEWVTVYEESHFCKPALQYYAEICEHIGVKPEDCIMVGNDVQEDMVASQLGMKTFLVTDYAVDRGHPHYRIDERGTLEELYAKLKNRSGIFVNR